MQFAKIAIPTLCCLAGLLIGGSSVEYGHRHLGALSKAKFEQRIRCKNIADKYAQDNSGGSVSIFISGVDYSESENTCIAAVETFTDKYERWSLIDLLTEDETTIGTCNMHDTCDKGLEFGSKMDSEFKQRTK